MGGREGGRGGGGREGLSEEERERGSGRKRDGGREREREIMLFQVSDTQIHVAVSNFKHICTRGRCVHTSTCLKPSHDTMCVL